MKHINCAMESVIKNQELTTNRQNGQKNLTKSRQQGKSDVTKEAADYFNKIFRRLVVICPAWKQGIDGDVDSWAADYKQELIAAIRDAGVTRGEQIRYGIEAYRAKGKPFLPAPGEFANLCSQQINFKGLSHKTAAYRKVCVDNPGRRQICHKRSNEDKARIIKNILALRSAIDGINGDRHHGR